MADVASALTTIQTCQAILSSLTALALTSYQFPQSATVKNGSTYDCIVVGSGAGGSTVASRLSEDGNTTVALFECGGVPPMESRLPGIFTLQPNSGCDWNVTSTDSNTGMTSGNMLGGSSSLDHMIYARGSEYDFKKWAAAAGDDSWLYENLMEYFKKSENCQASDILEAFSSYHGTSGPLGLTRETSDYNTNILNALEEIGNAIITDITANITLGCTEPLLLIADTYRQSVAETYLNQAKDRSNLDVIMNTCVTKVIIDSSGTATGVQATTSDGETITIYAKKEVIVSAGAIRTPQVLANSGIGPKAQLEAMDIECIADLPVGQNLSDHPACVLVYTLNEGDAVTVSNPHEFPVPMTTGYTAVNKSQDYPDYQTINLLFSPSSSGLLQLCSWVFKYSDEICQAYSDANANNYVLFMVVNLLHPNSRGWLNVTTTDITVNPEVNLGLYSDETDLDNMAACLLDLAPIVNSTYFKSVNSTLVNLNFTKCTTSDTNSLEFWSCHAKEMASTMWHYSGTASIGNVIDSDLKVKGLNNLRVVDASSMPFTIGGNIIAPIYAMAEKAADMIKEDWSLN